MTNETTTNETVPAEAAAAPKKRATRKKVVALDIPDGRTPFDGVNLDGARGLPGAKDRINLPPGPGRLSSREDVQQYLMKAIPFSWVRIWIEGVKPLLVNKARESSVLKMEDKQTGKAQQKKEPREPEKEYIESCHICTGRYDKAWLTRNVYGFPVIGIKKAMAAAGYRYGDAKNKVDSMGAFFIHGPYEGLAALRSTGAPEMMECGINPDRKGADKIESAIPVMRRDFVIIPQGRIGSIAYRPQFFPWTMELDIEYCPNFISRDNLLNYLHLAGRCIGLGSWRVENGGEKGRFKVAGLTDLPDDYVPEVFTMS